MGHVSCYVVQYRVMEDKVPSAYYKLTDSKRQIKSYVYDVVRGCVPKMELDQTFASKDTIANAVKDQLQHAMSEFGECSLYHDHTST